MLAADGKLGREFHQMASQEILRIFKQFFLRQSADQRDDHLGADKGKRDPAKAFGQRVRALQEQAELEDLMNAVLVQRLLVGRICDRIG